ncbi:pyruvate dehydrogenase (acetyl-transferring), homodimeric type [candidate division KSB1 bacterium]|nr:pyruvate dehydrogenase (acetyl-transferring), homodimeric type [candidate division KSB1 bacterium]
MFETIPGLDLGTNGNGKQDNGPFDEIETREWLESLDYVLETSGRERAALIMRQLRYHAQRQGVAVPLSLNTSYQNSIPLKEQPAFPGDRALERRIKSLVRWNAIAMVVRANRADASIGGHLSTYASAATLYEVGFNHFFRGKDHPSGGDLVYFQGHASPGIYSRAFLEGRLSEQQLANFRHELAPGGGLASYPHPWLMPDFWEFPTVSMGLGPINAIYQARFERYLEDRGLKPVTDSNVWAFLGDGETDEPEALGAISLAGREKLDNLIFVVNCNLQRLDGPVRGNGKIIQELERVFRGAGWNVIKVIWGDDWDPLLERDTEGLLVRRMAEVVDGDYQKYSVEPGSYVREHFFGVDPRLLKMVEHLSDDQLQRMRRGGHDPEKVHAGFAAAVQHNGQPTCVLVKTIKGYGLGESGEAKNITHQQKKLDTDSLIEFCERFELPIPKAKVGELPFYRPDEKSKEIQYLKERRAALGGALPRRVVRAKPVPAPPAALIEEYVAGTKDREVSTTMVFVSLLTRLLKEQDYGKLIVPIVPDEARTFGMESLFRQIGIYSHVGQLYDPVDRDQLLYYKEARDGQLLEEGITEAGSMSSFIAAGTGYANFGVPTIPFYIFYSMFGLQRTLDLAWAAGDIRCRGFMIGATSGRTTLNGEGLQHEDGNSHLLAYTIPNLIAYDPAYAYELAVIIRDGLRRMYEQSEDIFYYVTVMNENYVHPPMPAGAEAGILRGMYKLRGPLQGDKPKPQVHLLGSGTILNEVVAAQKLLAEQYNIVADVWSVTSYKELYKDATTCDRQNMLRPAAKSPRVPYVTQCFSPSESKATRSVFVAATDYVKALPDSIGRWLPGPLHSLGTDGFGRSESRAALRSFFEVDRNWIAYAALFRLMQQKEIDVGLLMKAQKALNIDPGKAEAVYV